MKRMPIETMIAPNRNIGAGTSRNRRMPNVVAPTGSSNARVAVSNDFKCDREEKYRVCATAVGSSPSPSSASTVSVWPDAVRTALPPNIPRTLTTQAVRA